MHIIHTSFAPNIELDDIILSLRLLINKKKSTQAIVKLKKALSNYFNNSNTFLFSSGRAALYYALKSINAEKNDEVITQTFTCVAVPNAIVWADLRPVFVDIDKTTYNINPSLIEKSLTKKTKAIIVQHTFGIPANINEIKTIAKKHNIVLIEDLAHSLGGSYENKKLGTFGDLAIISFGRDKTLSCVFGGAVVTKNREIAKNLLQFEKKLIQPPLLFVLQQLLYAPLYAIALPIYPILLGKAILRLASIIGILSKAVTNQEKIGKMPKFISWSFSDKLAELALLQFNKLSRFVQHRKNVGNLYSRLLNKKQKNIAYLRYPITVAKKNEFLKYCKTRNVYLGDWYSYPITPMPNNHILDEINFKEEFYPVAKYISLHIVNFPTHIGVNYEDAKKIISLYKSYLKYENKRNI